MNARNSLEKLSGSIYKIVQGENEIEIYKNLDNKNENSSRTELIFSVKLSSLFCEYQNKSLNYSQSIAVKTLISFE